MKLPILTLTLSLPVVCAAAAAAQMAPVHFIAPVNPVSVLPTLMPGPMSGPLTGTGVSLPTPLPGLLPSPSLTLGSLPRPIEVRLLPRPLAAARAAEGFHDKPVDPLRRAMPDYLLRYEAKAPGASQAAPAQTVPAGSAAAQQRLNEAFDGAARPEKIVVTVPPARKPVASGRRIGLPEDDFREFGL